MPDEISMVSAPHGAIFTGGIFEEESKIDEKGRHTDKMFFKSPNKELLLKCKQED